MLGIIYNGYRYFVKYSTVGKEVFDSGIQTKNAYDESSGSLEDRVKIGIKGIKTVTGVACLGTEILVDTRILAKNGKIKMSFVASEIIDAGYTIVREDNSYDERMQTVAHSVRVITPLYT